MNCQYCKKYKVVENENYCKFHTNLKLLNEEEIIKSHKCIRCPRLIFNDNKRCDECIESSKKLRSTPPELKCMFRDGCIFNKKIGLNYCDKHKYLQDYTEEMLNNLKMCSGCKKKVLLKNGLKTCDKCLLRSKNNKLSEKNKDLNTKDDNQSENYKN